MTPDPIQPLAPADIKLADIERARARISAHVSRFPLLRLQHDLEGERPGPEIYLKLENLQAIGSFKLRGAANALAQLPADVLRDGVCTASAGNMAQGVGWIARELGVPFQVAVPDSAPKTKLDAIRRLGGEIVSMPFETWWTTLRDRGHPALRGHFIHPVSDPQVICGNATLGLEILEDLPDVDAIIVPYGGGGLSSGIACAARAVRPEVRVFGAEVLGAAPLARAWAAGEPTPGEHRRTFVDGIGSGNLLPEMWPLVRAVLAGSIVVSADAIQDAVRLLVERHHVVAEGAGAASVAAALSRDPRCTSGKVACVVSGGNLDLAVLAQILKA